jgi:hypothetical protein
MEAESGTSPASSSDSEEIRLENARIGYQAAISLMAIEGNLVWARYGLMLVAHTIILTATGLASNMPSPAKTVTLIGLPLVGLALCLVWWLVNDIGFRYYFYCLFSARELEESYLDPIRTLSRGTPFTRGELVSIVIAGKERRLPLGPKDRIRILHASNVVIVVVGLLYITFLAVFLAS